ncbi:non-homologous end-joining DNA ligase [Streptomyces sp. NPDC053755]|uniref:non-homologous end-joining DNA ligase n=1 Tax=Streptomyces sp. NPDC053755 TaxID=3155815 RepID=UPI003449BDDA
MAGAKESIRIGGRAVEYSRPDKPLFPEDGLTKADLVAYYRTVAARMVPHLRGRPLMLERHPDGIGAGGFMQKDLPEHFPDWVHHAELPKSDGRVTYVICDDAATLAYLAGQACITPHRFLSRADRPDHPDRLVFDLDPPGDDFAPVREAARQLHELLEEVALPSSVMTTGSRGLHVIVPLDRRAPFDDVRAFARDLATLLADRHPDTLTTEARKKARGDRLYLDIQRNAYAQTAVAPYAARARPGAPVAAPVTWADVDSGDLAADHRRLADVERLLAEDPWRDAPRRGRSLGPARRRLDALRG